MRKLIGIGLVSALVLFLATDTAMARRGGQGMRERGGAQQQMRGGGRGPVQQQARFGAAVGQFPQGNAALGTQQQYRMQTRARSGQCLWSVQGNAAPGQIRYGYSGQAMQQGAQYRYGAGQGGGQGQGGQMRQRVRTPAPAAP